MRRHEPRLQNREWLISSVSAILIFGCGGDAPLMPEPDEQLSAGLATVFDDSALAFSRPIPGMERELERTFFRGRALFRDDWVAAPASTDSRDGLGPLFNARSCEACHVQDGRGRPPVGDEPTGSLLFRLSVPGASAGEPPLPEPTYGGQVHPLAIPGVAAESEPQILYTEQPGMYADGEGYSLRQPSYQFDNLSLGPMADGVMVSPRVAPSMIGLGLLEAIPEAAIMALVDENDTDGDGISGRANRVASLEFGGESTLGRFGLKSNQPSVRQQVAGAFLGDIGLTSSLFPEETCTSAQMDCSEAISGGTPELLDVILDDVTSYSRLLAVPARRDWDTPPVLRGKQTFMDLGCADCHVPSWQIGTFDDLPHLSGMTIRPYTDLLLHDMGDALADNRPDYRANGREWRTPPLWGVGLLETVNGHQFLMHDGRARGFAEAILWHGGEAQASRDTFIELSQEKRDELVAFLESL